MTGDFDTTILLYDEHDNEREVSVTVEYEGFDGDDGDWDTPPEPAYIELLSVIDDDNHDYSSELSEANRERLEQEAIEDANAERIDKLL